MSKEKETVSIPVFAVEIDAPRNNDVILQSIPGCRLRSAIDGSKPVIDPVSGDPVGVPVDQAAGLSPLGRIPGQQIHVNASRLSYKIVDGLHGEDEALARVQKYMERRGAFRTDTRLAAEASRTGDLDVDRMKTLVRELRQLVETNYAKVVRGTLPEMRDIENLPGNFLLNPGSMVRNSQPKYEKDLPAWEQSLDRLVTT